MNHNLSKYYYEHFARLLLEWTFPELYTDIKFSDKPDLICGEYGIEVTRAMFDNAGELDGILARIMGKPVGELKKGEKAIFEKNNTKILVYDDCVFGYSPPAVWHSNKEIKKCFEVKLNKIKTYTPKKYMGLFVFSPLFDYYDIDMINEFVDWSINKQKGNKDKFSIVYIYDQDNLFICDLINNEVMVKPLEKFFVGAICEASKICAENMK